MQAQQTKQVIIVQPPSPQSDDTIEIGGVKIHTGLSWYWEVSIVIGGLLLIYACKKLIDQWFFNRRKDNEEEFDPQYTTVFMKKSERDGKIEKIMKKRKK